MLNCVSLCNVIFNIHAHVLIDTTLCSKQVWIQQSRIFSTQILKLDLTQVMLPLLTSFTQMVKAFSPLVRAVLGYSVIARYYVLLTGRRASFRTFTLKILLPF